MPKTPVDEAPAGPAMNAAVAGALGWHYGWGGWWEDEEGQIQKPACIGCDGKSTWSPSEDIAAAWKLIENLSQLFGVEIGVLYPEAGSGERFYCKIWKHHSLQFRALFVLSAPLAICRAFLKANGVEFVDVP